MWQCVWTIMCLFLYLSYIIVTPLFSVTALIRQTVIERCSVSRGLPCSACVLWSVGRTLCSWAEWLILPLAWMWQALYPWLLPSPHGYVYLGAGTQELGRSLPLSGCLVCPGLEAIVICYCSGGGKGRMKGLHAAFCHPPPQPVSLSSADIDKCLVKGTTTTAMTYREWEPKSWGYNFQAKLG